MKLNPFDRKYLATPKSRLIFSIALFEFGAFILWVLFVVALGGLDFWQIISMTILLCVLGAIAGALMWATVYEPFRRSSEKRWAKQKETLGPDCVNIRIKEFFKKKRLTTPRATLMYALFFFGRIALFVFVVATLGMVATGAFTWGWAAIVFVVFALCATILGLYAWRRVYEPTRKKIEQQEKDAAESPQP